MLIRPKLAFMVLGTDMHLDPCRSYRAIRALNLPHGEASGAIFIDGGPASGALLHHGDYDIIEDAVANAYNESLDSAQNYCWLVSVSGMSLFAVRSDVEGFMGR